MYAGPVVPYGSGGRAQRSPAEEESSHDSGNGDLRGKFIFDTDRRVRTLQTVVVIARSRIISLPLVR